MKKIVNRALLGVLGILFAGCSTPVKSPSEMSNLPDPVPRAEPLSRTGNPPSYEVFGKRYYIKNTSKGYRERGIASWYGKDFHGKKTSSGAPYDMYAISAAHKSLPIPTYVRVTNLENNRSIVVRVDDRGPFVDGRIIDLSYAAAAKLGLVEQGTAPVEVVALPPYQHLPDYEPNTGAVARNIPAPAAPAADFRLAPRPVASTSVSQIPAADPRLLQRPASAPLVSQTGNQAEQASRVNTPRPGTIDLVTTESKPTLGQQSDACYLQIGAFADLRNAERLQSRLSGRLNHAVRIDFGSDNLHRVRIGPLRDVSEAKALTLKLTTLGINQPHIVFN